MPLTKVFKLLVLFIVVFLSCNDKAVIPLYTKRNLPMQPDSSLLADSLNTDKSAFQNDNYPDSAKKFLYSSNHQLLSYVIGAYNAVSNQDTFFSAQSLKNEFVANRYSIDSSIEKISFYKSGFNKRELLEYSKTKKGLKFTFCTQLWHSGKKYQLVWMWFPPEKKDNTVVDNF